MRKRNVEVEFWKVGDTVISNTTDFEITEGKEYTIIKEAEHFKGSCFIIVDDTGEDREYSTDYFNIKETM
jgi:adenine/guanine phosphoribosyltransferase-like PRPP-binding protein